LGSPAWNRSSKVPDNLAGLLFVTSRDGKLLSWISLGWTRAPGRSRGWKFCRADIVIQTVVWRLLQQKSLSAELEQARARRPRRTLFIDPDGTSVTVAAGQNEPLAFHVVEEEGWL
jgi:hypothetical protein